MNEKYEDIWYADVNAICITTNGTVLPNGRNIMGGGIAREALDRVRGLDLTHGNLITKYGHRFQYLAIWKRFIDQRDIMLWAFPSKKVIHVNSDLETIEDSLTSLVNVAHAFPKFKFGLPRPGSNLGGLSWERDVKDLVATYVTAEPNITVYHYAQTGVPLRMIK